MLLVIPAPPLCTLFAYTTLFRSIEIDHHKPSLDDRLLELITPALDADQSVVTEATIATPDRTIGAKVANAIAVRRAAGQDRKSTRLNSSHLVISYAVVCMTKNMC